MRGFLKQLFQRRRQARAADGENQRRVEENFDHVIAGVKDYAIVLLDMQGRILTWNEGARRIEGYEAAEIIGQHFSRFYTNDALQRGWPQSQLDAAKAKGTSEEEDWRLRKDGSRFWANVVITALKDGAGKPRGFLTITRDLTAAKDAQEALRQSEERFRFMIKGIRDYAIFMLDEEGNVTTWNEGAQRINGYEAWEIIGRHFSCFYPEEARVQEWPAHELRQALSNGVYEEQGWRLRKNGSRFWANVLITPIYDEAGAHRGFTKVTRDLSERKTSEEELKLLWADLEHRVEERTQELTEANKALKAEVEERARIERQRARLEEELRRRVEELAEGDRQKNEFLAMLGHELRNPLAPLRNALQIFKMPGVDESTISRVRDMMERQLLHLIRLVDDLLDVARIMRGKVELQREKVDLVSVLGQAIEMSRPVIDGQGHELVVSAPEQGILVDGDPVRLAQVLNNLLVNAAKYTPEPGRIWLTAERREGGVSIRVKDTGIGIAPELLPRIFDLFVQADRTLARSQGGLGIGLTLVRRLVEVHGGRVEARSEGPGKGSEFEVWLPTVAEKSGSTDESTTRTVGSMHPRRILVVDDNVDAADTAATLLKLWGHEVTVVNDGLSVLQAVRDLHPEIILLDIGLPGMTGYEVARQIRSEPEFDSLVIAAMTGYGQVEDFCRTKEAGFNYHLTKPLDPGRLQAIFGSLG